MSEHINSSDAPKKSYRIYILLAIVIVGAFFYFFFTSVQKRKAIAKEAAEASAAQITRVRVTKPFFAPDTAVLLLPGNVQGYRETYMYARVNGYVKNWYVDIGDHVKEGQLLADLETPELDQQLAQARANLELAKTSLERVNSVTVEGAVSVQQKADREGAYKAALALVNQLEAQKSFKNVLAPFAGIITSRNVDIGTLVNAGSSTSQQLFTISQINKLRIFVYVPQSFVENIKVGTQAKIVVQEISAKPIIGKVTRTAGALDPNTRTMLTQVEFENPEHLYLPGMYAKVKFVAKRKARAIVIPASTLALRTEGTRVIVVKPDNTIAVQTITIDRDNGATIELSSGLNGDELLVTNPSLDLAEGTKVEVAGKSTDKE